MLGFLDSGGEPRQAGRETRGEQPHDVDSARRERSPRDESDKNASVEDPSAATRTEIPEAPIIPKAAALAIPDEMVSNRIVAYVSLSSDTTAAELTNFCAGRIQRYMVPEAIMINPVLPKTSTGKIDRQTLFKEHMA